MKTTFYLALWIVALLLIACSKPELSVNPSPNDLIFEDLAPSWDEGIPLGNATLGALIWKKDTTLRISLDRIDLWDLRPTENIWGENFSFKWVQEQVAKNDYLPVQQYFDIPYDRDPAPSKIPGAGMEFDIAHLGPIDSVRLFLNNAVSEIKWKNGARFKTFVHATKPVGFFVASGMDVSFLPKLVPPIYENQNEKAQEIDPVTGQSLLRLGYKQGEVTQVGNKINYKQKGWEDFSYEVAIKYEQKGDLLIGVWSITSSLVPEQASQLVDEYLAAGIQKNYVEHLNWWQGYWAKSEVNIPDEILQKQYYNELYKFGSVAREDSYPIALQAVWTADNGKLPPWKGDYHHDLNTQLSYWPAYAGNRLQEGFGYLKTLWDQRETHKKYTKAYFGTSGLNVPGVTTLTGEPMGGWIQYSFSPTISAWLAQHFYLHWKYASDTEFLKTRAYPYIKEVAVHLEELTRVKEGLRTLPLSSSPEIFDNSQQAWLPSLSNYDLSLLRFTFTAAGEMAEALQLQDEAKRWKEILNEYPDYELDEDGGLVFAKGIPYESSHRHFSHLMAIHPLGLIDWSNGEKDQQTIRATLKTLQEVGPSAWTGYSYSWLANLQARAFDGEGAAQSLRDFATAFCLGNTFHVNGDQSNTGKSSFTYRPFTLEGNFAFASGIHEMLIQSHTGIVRLFPAIPDSWQDVSFKDLRAVGAFLISADRKNGKTNEIKIYSEKGGKIRLANPFMSENLKAGNKAIEIKAGIIELELKPGEKISIRI
jgi:alpha-L-fucosidase 2